MRTPLLVGVGALSVGVALLISIAVVDRKPEFGWPRPLRSLANSGFGWLQIAILLVIPPAVAAFVVLGSSNFDP